MGKRFAESREDNTSQVGQFVKALHHSLKGARGNPFLRVSPDVSDTGSTMQVAMGGRFDVKLPCIRKAWMKDQITFTSIQPKLCAWRNMPTLEEFFG